MLLYVPRYKITFFLVVMKISILLYENIINFFAKSYSHIWDSFHGSGNNVHVKLPILFRKKLFA